MQIIEGPLHARKKQYLREVFFSIASYEQIYRDIDRNITLEFDLIVLDETQRIKNWNTRTAKSIKGLKSTYAIALTGTPLENRIEELHSIVEFIDRYRLGPLFAFLDCHEVKDERGKVIGYRDLSEIGKSLKTILIRRQKKEVQQQLPPRLEKVHFTPMTELQKEYHNDNADIVRRIAAKWARNHYLSEADHQKKVNWSDKEVIATCAGMPVLGVIRIYPPTSPGARSPHSRVMLLSPVNDLGINAEKVLTVARKRYTID